MEGEDLCSLNAFQGSNLAGLCTAELEIFF